MEKGRLLKILCDEAKSYCLKAIKRIHVNKHMNEYQDEEVSQAVADALIVDFINFIGESMGVDLAFYTKNLRDRSTFEGPEDFKKG